MAKSAALKSKLQPVANIETDAAEALKTPHEPDVFAQMVKLTAEDWQGGWKVYIYRVWPVIDRRTNEHFIAKESGPVDEDHILRYYGSGKYFLRLNNSQGETVASKTVSLHNPNFPPKVSPDEVVASDPKNETYFKVWAPKENQPANQASPPLTPESTALQELTRLIGKLVEQRENTAPPADPAKADAMDKLFDWALKQKDKEVDANDPTRLAALIHELKSLMPAPQQPHAAAPDPLASLDRAVDLLKKLQPAAPTPASDPMMQIRQTAELVSTLKETFGTADGAATRESNMTGWQEFLKEPLTEFVQILKPFAQVGAAILHSRVQPQEQQQPPRQAQANAPTTARPVPPGAPRPPAAQPSGAESANDQPPQHATSVNEQAPPPGNNTQIPPDPTMIVLQAALTHVDFTLRDYFANDASGTDFAAWFCDTAIPLPPPFNIMQESMMGTEALVKIRQFTATDPQGNIVPAPEGGKQIILAAYKQSPEIWKRLITSPDKERKFEKFLDEFLQYDPDAANNEDESEGSPKKKSTGRAA